MRKLELNWDDCRIAVRVPLITNSIILLQFGGTCSKKWIFSLLPEKRELLNLIMEITSLLHEKTQRVPLDWNMKRNLE